MPSIVLACRKDPAAVNGAGWLIDLYDFKHCEGPVYDGEGYQSGSVYLEFTEVDPVFLDGCSFGRFDVVVILSRHSGRGGERRLTVHVPGNPGGNARFGGEPYGLGLAAPCRVKAALQALAESVEYLGLDGWHVSMEGTHHGPTGFDAPVIFVEIGSSEDEWSLPDAGEALSKGAWAAATLKAAGRRAVGFGGDHYCGRFTKAVLSCELAVGHAFPRYNFPGLRFDVVSYAFTRTVEGCSLAAVDWKGLKGRDRMKLLKSLESLNVEVVKV